MSILCLAIQVVFVVSVAIVYYFRLYKLHGISVKEWEEMKEDNFLMRELLNNLPIPTTVKTSRITGTISFGTRNLKIYIVSLRTT